MPHNKGSDRCQHVAKPEILSQRREKILEMTGGLYDSDCAVDHGKIMVCLIWLAGPALLLALCRPAGPGAPAGRGKGRVHELHRGIASPVAIRRGEGVQM